VAEGLDKTSRGRGGRVRGQLLTDPHSLAV